MRLQDHIFLTKKKKICFFFVILFTVLTTALPEVDGFENVVRAESLCDVFVEVSWEWQLRVKIKHDAALVRLVQQHHVVVLQQRAPMTS